MKIARRLLLCLAALVACRIDVAASKAAEPKPASNKPAPRSKLDDALLEGLDDPAEQETLGKQEEKPSRGKPATDEPAAAGKAKSNEPAPKGKRRPAGGDLDDELLKGLGDGEDVELGGKPGQPAEGGRSANPLVDLGRQMREVESRIAQTKSDEETQKLQDGIASDLQKLIKQLQRRKKQSSSSSSSSNKDQQTAEREKVEQPATGGAGRQAASDSPAKESTETLKDRQTEKVETAQLDEALKDIWGQLPAHLRQQMEQYAKEELLPKYELQIEEYFRALAKGQRERP